MNYSKNWRYWEKGDCVVYLVYELGSYIKYIGIVKEVTDTHAIVEADSMHLWCDDDLEELFHWISR